MTNWYVSKAGAGAKDGTSVATAWAYDGVVKGSMAAGDTLYVIGEIRGINGWDPFIDGSAGNYFTLAGYDSTSAIILGPEYESSVWSGPDAYGAYSIDYSNDNIWHLAEWTTASGFMSSYSMMVDAGKDPDGDWIAGNFYNNTTTDKLYWKPLGGTITGKTATVGAMFEFFVEGTYRKVDGIKTVLLQWAVGIYTSSSYIWLNNVTATYPGRIRIRNSQGEYGVPNDHIRVSYCDLSYADCGVYSFGQIEAYDNDYLTIDHNYIHHMTSSGDAHAIGVQGGDNHIIECNELAFCNTGITMYSSIWQSMNNNIIRYNRVHDMEVARGNSTGYGIGYETTNRTANQCTGNYIHHNLVYDNEGPGIILKFIDPSNFVYNNTCSGNGTNYYSFPVTTDDNMGGTVKNNISVNPVYYHFYLSSTSGDFSGFTFSNNLYYPDGAAKFWSSKLGSPYTTNLSGFVTHVEAFGGTEDDTLTSDPLLIGTYQLGVGSPAIDAGIDWGQSQDIIGTTKQGSFWDLGAYEYFELISQHSFRFINDNGDEDESTFNAGLNANITLAPGNKIRVRFLLDTSGDIAGKQFQIEYRRKPSGGEFGSWKKII